MYMYNTYIIRIYNIYIYIYMYICIRVYIHIGRSVSRSVGTHGKCLKMLKNPRIT